MSMTRQQILKKGYPENLITDIGLELIFDKPEYIPLSDDQKAGLDQVIGTLLEREQKMIQLRYMEKQTLQEIGEHYGLSRERVRQVIAKGLRKLRHPSRIAFIRDGCDKAELNLKI